MLSKNTLDKLRDELDSCQRPLFFFDDDPDGLCAFLLFYRCKQDGKGIPVKSSSLNKSFASFVARYEPDKIFVLDVPVIDTEFLEAMAGQKIPVIWLDHHGPAEEEKRSLTMYFNPKMENKDDISCTTANAYGAVQRDLWIGMVGAVGDWQLPPYTKEFCAQFPELLSASVTLPEVALFKEPIGRLVKIFSFLLKGSTSTMHKCLKIMTRIEHPDELLKQTTSRGKFVMKHAGRIEQEYHDLFRKAAAEIKKIKGRVAVFTYKDDRMSFTKELSNEFIFLYPKKVILIGRERGDEMKMSIRTPREDLRPLIKQALRGIWGYGGGHEHACGACVKVRDFPVFYAQLKALVETEKK